MIIPALVLAAGTSTRMGRPKATLPLPGDHTFLTRILQTCRDAGVEDVVVVVGHEADAVMTSVEGRGLHPRFVRNPAFERGQFSSLLAGLRVVDRPGVGAFLLMLVDVPLVTADTVRAVVRRHHETAAPIVRPSRGAQHGHPVLIARRLFAALYAGDPEQGAKPIVRAHASAAGDVEVADDGAFLDVDTQEDYERAIKTRAAE